MKICVVVPSEDQMNQAGVRIRYKRIANSIFNPEDEITVTPIQNLTDKDNLSHDIYLISKCYDARSILLVNLLSETDKLVGIDIFDDYFSQELDSRFTRLRYWFYSMLSNVDFVICSTRPMYDVINRIEPNIPIHIMNDPSLPFNAGEIITSLAHKLQQVHKFRKLTISWFGIGDNPYFPVGLHDLVAFSEQLARLRNRGYEVDIEILTNVRALTSDNLAMLRRLPLPYSVDEWTEQKEITLLKKNLVCFLPVNAQNFSLVKSLNRAVTALCSGVQVLSSGYPLYDPLSEFIYRDPLELLRDVDGKSLLLRPETVANLGVLMEKWADATNELIELTQFLGRCNKRQRTSTVNIIHSFRYSIIHGKDIIGDVHKFAKRMDELSVSGPYSKQKISFDLHFSFSADNNNLELYVLDQIVPKLPQTVLKYLGDTVVLYKRNYQKLELLRLRDDLDLEVAAVGSLHTNISFIASYTQITSTMVKIISSLFPGIVCIYSDAAKLPWWDASYKKPDNPAHIQ